jgi:hypothetical protein
LQMRISWLVGMRRVACGLKLHARSQDTPFARFLELIMCACQRGEMMAKKAKKAPKKPVKKKPVEKKPNLATTIRFGIPPGSGCMIWPEQKGRG